MVVDAAALAGVAAIVVVAVAAVASLDKMKEAASKYLLPRAVWTAAKMTAVTATALAE